MAERRAENKADSITALCPRCTPSNTDGQMPSLKPEMLQSYCRGKFMSSQFELRAPERMSGIADHGDRCLRRGR